MDLDKIRSNVLAFQQAGRTYDFLDLGWRYLSAVPSDPPVADAVVQQLAACGLGGPARELLQMRGDLRSTADSGGTLRSVVQSSAPGRVPWPQLKDQYTANLQLLLDNQPHLAGIEAQLDSAVRHVHLYRTSEGHYLLSQRQAGQLREWPCGLTDYSAETRIELPPLNEATLAVLDGLTLGPLTDRLFQATADLGVNHDCALFVVEPDCATLAAWLHTADRSHMLTSDRVYIFCGPEALQAFESFLCEQVDLTPAIAYIVTPPGIQTRKEHIAQVCARAETRHRKQITDIQVRLAQRYAQRDQAYWRERLNKPRRVLGITSRRTTMLQYSTRDIGHALQELGSEFHLVLESANHRQLTTLIVGKAVEEFDPDLVILVDHLRYEYGGLLFNIPVLSWIQDPMPNLLCHRAGESMGPLDFVCGYYRKRCVEQFGYPAERFFSAAVPVSTRVFHDGSVAEEEPDRWRCEVMYVGHLHHTLEGHYHKWRSESESSAGPVLDAIYEQVTNMLAEGRHMGKARPMVEKILADLGYGFEEEILDKTANFFAFRLFDIGFRCQTLEWVGQWAAATGRTFRLYGNGWQDHPTLARFAVGPVEHGEPLRRAYRGARLVIQTLPGGFVHQRSFEALTCGSLVLARYSPGNFGGLTVEEFVRRRDAGEEVKGPACRFPGLEHVAFRDADDFAQLADHYLKDETQYRDRLSQMQTTVAENCTYRAVLKELLGGIQKILARGEK